MQKQATLHTTSNMKNYTKYLSNTYIWWLSNVMKKGLDIYIPLLTGKPWPGPVYISKWHTDRQWL